MSNLTQNEIDEIVVFIIDHYAYTDEDRMYIDWLINEHAKFNTMMVIRSQYDGYIVAVSRWNILPTGQDAHIMDIVIHPEWRHKYLMKRMLLKGLRMYPEVRYLIFERQTEGKPFKKVPVKWLLTRRF